MPSVQDQTVEEYIHSLAEDRQAAVTAVRTAILENLPAGYQETMQHGMISYVIPLETYPVTYNKQPLMFDGLASQKNYMTVYLMNIYGNLADEEWFVERFKATGKKMKVGKSCARFEKLEDLPLGLIGEAVARTPVSGFIQLYEFAKGLR